MTAEPIKSSNNIKVKMMNNTSSYSIENGDVEVRLFFFKNEEFVKEFFCNFNRKPV